LTLKQDQARNIPRNRQQPLKRREIVIATFGLKAANVMPWSHNRMLFNRTVLYHSYFALLRLNGKARRRGIEGKGEKIIFTW
jgi:hypothetical protein